MDVGWCVLQSGVLGLDESSNHVRRLVVHLVKTRFVAAAGQVCIGDLICSEEFFFGSVLDGN